MKKLWREPLINQPFARNKGESAEFRFYTEFQSHEPEFDYLKSLEIEEKINQIRWLKRVHVRQQTQITHTERQRETDRQTDRQAGRQIDRQRQRQRQRQRDKDRETKTER